MLKQCRYPTISCSGLWKGWLQRQGKIVAELGGAVLLECLGMSHDADLRGSFSCIEQYARDAGVDMVRAYIQVPYGFY